MKIKSFVDSSFSGKRKNEMRNSWEPRTKKRYPGCDSTLSFVLWLNMRPSLAVGVVQGLRANVTSTFSSTLSSNKCTSAVASYWIKWLIKLKVFDKSLPVLQEFMADWYFNYKCTKLEKAMVYSSFYAIMVCSSTLYLHLLQWNLIWEYFHTCEPVQPRSAKAYCSYGVITKSTRIAFHLLWSSYSLGL